MQTAALDPVFACRSREDADSLGDAVMNHLHTKLQG
jgi:hypothetical protein